MSGSLFAPFRSGVSTFSLFANRAAMKLPLGHGTGAFSNFIQAARAPTKKIVAGGMLSLTYYTTAIQLKDNYDDYTEKKITGLEASLGSTAAVCGLLSGNSSSILWGFAWAQSSSMLTAGKYIVGGQKAMSEKNNKIDFANSLVAKYSTAIPGSAGAGISVLSAIVTTQLSATHEQIMKTKLDESAIWPALSSMADRYAKDSEFESWIFD